MPVLNIFFTSSTSAKSKQPCSSNRNLPDSYFENTRISLPSHPGQVHHSIRNLFPIRDRAKLQFLSEYRRKLQKYYILNNKLPTSYFDLSSEKLDLLSIPQALIQEIRYLFLCNSKNNSELRDLVAKLRCNYKFKKLPSNFIIHKKQLPILLS
ncbi:401_t:CDS:2 [Dentiscutata heterogama]|uniref:401_t:CDS:1 n=1 Tax=Dentiscutata heterogama TaxID=1316150 RepID=A0ACA9LRX2_9GLOM|nr:401_t:CDS:2 [Dentiscutata heterogama]